MVHGRDQATPTTLWSVVTIETDHEKLAARAPGAVSLDRLVAHLEGYREEQVACDRARSRRRACGRWPGRAGLRAASQRGAGVRRERAGVVAAGASGGRVSAIVDSRGERSNDRDASRDLARQDSAARSIRAPLQRSSPPRSTPCRWPRISWRSPSRLIRSSRRSPRSRREGSACRRRGSVRSTRSSHF